MTLLQLLEQKILKTTTKARGRIAIKKKKQLNFHKTDQTAIVSIIEAKALWSSNLLKIILQNLLLPSINLLSVSIIRMKIIATKMTKKRASTKITPNSIKNIKKVTIITNFQPSKSHLANKMTHLTDNSSINHLLKTPFLLQAVLKKVLQKTDTLL
jgi:hypothetical protein